ncbi:MAG: alpha-1,2-fucosyltransferase [Clostridiales bacterium]|nr:alpha-1,2-fucosyltransferase [Clostridiales bacterium]
MIIVQFSGGLGNQLGQYGLYLEYEARGFKTYADLSWYRNGQSTDGKVDIRSMELSLLGLSVKECPKLYEYYGKQGGLHRYIRRLCVGHTYMEEGYKFTPALLDVDRGYVMGGSFIGEEYITNCADELRSSISFKGTDAPYIKEMERRISETDSVSIHMRLGDYLNNNSLYGNICTPEYYRRAVEHIRSNVPDATFFLFSNDVKAASELLGIEGVVPVEGNTGDRSYLDMYLMSRCRHNIIANSTFSWWGAWLNNKEGRIVICPTTLLNGYDNGSVYCNDWVRIGS